MLKKNLPHSLILANYKFVKNGDWNTTPIQDNVTGCSWYNPIILCGNGYIKSSQSFNRFTSFISGLGFPDPNTTPETPDLTKSGKKKGAKKGRASGYIMFAAEYRKDITNKNKELSFGEISRIVGQKWKVRLIFIISFT